MRLKRAIVAVVTGVVALAGHGALGQSRQIIYAWAPKRAPLTPCILPNKPLWKLSDVLAMHAGQRSWTQPILRSKDLAGDYHQLEERGTTAPSEYPDNRVCVIVWGGQLRVTMEGQQTFVATKGFEIDIPFRVPFTLENVGDQPALWFEIHQANDLPIYPVATHDKKPDDLPGYQYTKVILEGGAGTWDENNRPFLDYYKDVLGAGGRAGAFIASDHMFVNNIRGMGVPRPPDSDLGHFHVDFTESWFIMEGKIDYQIEGVPFFTAEPGDVVTAELGQWHRASFSAGQMDTRVAINPFPRGLHDFPEASGGRQ